MEREKWFYLMARLMKENGRMESLTGEVHILFPMVHLTKAIFLKELRPERENSCLKMVLSIQEIF